MILNTLKEKFGGGGKPFLYLGRHYFFVAAIAAIIILAVSCPSGKSIYLDETETDNEPIPSHIYTVMFNPLGGNWSGSTAPISVKTDGYYRAAVPPEPEKSGFSFAGWHLQDSVDSAEFTSSTVVKSNMIVYAVWTGGASSITFYYNYAGAKTEVFSKKFIVAPETTTILPETPVRKNYAFQGWYTTPQTDIEFSDNTPSEDKFILGVSEISDDTSLWALWQRRPANSIVVQFEPYPGAFLGSAFVMADNGWKLPEGTSLPLTGSRPHYNPESADHWFMEDGSEFNLDTVLSPDDGDKIVSAKWTGKTYTVHFMVGEGGSEHASASVTYPQNTVTLPATMPTKENCYNDGFWYNGEDRFTNQTIVTGNTNVYPKWITAIMALTSLSAKYGSLSANLNQISNTAYTCSLPSFVESVVVQAIGEGPQGSTVTFDPADKTISSWGIGDNKTVTITIHSGLDSTTKVYTVTFEKRSEVETQMASGGTVTFLKNGTGTIATWDELHTFTTVGSDQLVFNAANPNINARILLVAGGGGGGGAALVSTGSTHRGSGGGGGGGVVHKNAYSITAQTSTVTVGGGGAKGSNGTSTTNGANGGDSIFASGGITLKALGGGGGARHGDGQTSTGSAGGSSGGSSYGNTPVAAKYWNGSTAVNVSTGAGAPDGTRQGNKGGASDRNVDIGGGGGGGGAGGVGGASNSSKYQGGNGGVGWQCDITGQSVYYAGGGAGDCSIPAGTGNNVIPQNGTGDIGQGGKGASGNWIAASAGKAGTAIVRFQYSE